MTVRDFSLPGRGKVQGDGRRARCALQRGGGQGGGQPTPAGVRQAAL